MKHPAYTDGTPVLIGDHMCITYPNDTVETGIVSAICFSEASMDCFLRFEGSRVNNHVGNDFASVPLTKVVK